ncbi:MAG: hypothetical protein WC052_03440 [Patescibacteria group bacterium]|jgi:hypothetical protein
MKKKKMPPVVKQLQAKVAKHLNNKTVNSLNDKVAMLASDLMGVTADVKTLAKRGKAHYEALDANTKRNAKIALGALAALLTIKAVSSAKGKKKGKK